MSKTVGSVRRKRYIVTMHPEVRQHSVATVVALMLLLLVPFLAYQQYIWLGQLSEQEYARMKANLRAAAFHFSVDFNRQIVIALQTFGAPLSGSGDDLAVQFAARGDRWESQTSYPRLVHSVWLVDRDTAWYLDRTGQMGAPETVPTELIGWCTDARDSGRSVDVEVEPGFSISLLKNLKAFVVPIDKPMTGLDGPTSSREGERCVVVAFDVRVRSVLVPMLAIV